MAAAPPARLSRPSSTPPPVLVRLRADPKPVEVDDVGWATRQVGLDLHALKVEQPEASQADPNTTVAILRNEAATLRSVMPQGARPCGSSPGMRYASGRPCLDVHQFISRNSSWRVVFSPISAWGATMSFKILSLDGGGTWAALEVMALEAMHPGLRGREILAQFDMAVANSGGSIVLAGLILDLKPEEILGFFKEKRLREKIFFSRPWIWRQLSRLPIFPRYIAEKKREGLLSAFGDEGLTPLSRLPDQPTWPKGPGGQPVRILIISFDYERMRADYLRGYSIPSTGAEPEEIALVDAVHASTNAPVTFFDAPAIVGNKRYWDGAMGGYNNPLMAGVVDAVSLGVTAPIRALTIGTGTVRLVPRDLAREGTEEELIAPSAKPGIIGDAGKAAGCITDDPPDAATYTAHIVLGNPPDSMGGVVRLNPVVQPISEGHVWVRPRGLSKELFQQLAHLQMDAVKPEDVEKILKLGQAWIADSVPNQPIRMADDLSCCLGLETFSGAVEYWRTL